MKKMEEQSGYVPPGQTPWWAPIWRIIIWYRLMLRSKWIKFCCSWRIMCTTDMDKYDGKELLEFTCKIFRTRARQETSNCDLPWWKSAKKVGKSLLFAITKQPQDAFERTYTQNTIPWHRLANGHTLKVSDLLITARYCLKSKYYCQFLVSSIFSMHRTVVPSTETYSTHIQ